MIAGASRHANLTLIDYQSDPLILESRWYSDLTHYSGEINDRIILDIAHRRARPPIEQGLLEQQVALPESCDADGVQAAGFDR